MIQRRIYFMKHAAKRIFALALALLLSLSFISVQIPDASITVSAHSGRTDSHGGHHDYKNVSGLGSYHYHHGYPAHLHENGVCPYDNPQPVDTEITIPEASPAITETPDTGAADSPVISLTDAPVVDYTLVFNAAFYAAANPDVAAVYGTDAMLLFQHFLISGMQEGRQGNAEFNVWNYRAANPDLAAAFGDDLPQYYTYYCMMNG